jgi:hypothetical protein
MTAMPSPWRPARNITIAPEDRPPYIASQIKFPGANATAFQSPEKFQEIQMSLACALRLPLEKIRITNITITDPRMPSVIIDATRFLLSSNGTVGCFKIERNASNVTTASTGRSLRRLQTSTSQAQVDYYIVEPPTEILALTPAEFSSVMESSAAMAEVSASVGSTGVVAITEASLAASGEMPSSGSGSGSGSVSGSTPSNGVIIGGAIGGVLFAAVVVSAFVGFSQMRKRAAHRATNLTQRMSTSGSVQVVHLNPIPGNPRLSPPQHQIWGRVVSQRGPMAFEAQKTRTGV